MNSETPLTEVAHHLPAQAAGILGDCPNAIQIAVLTTIRSFVCHLETAEVTLDPIQYDIILAGVAYVLIPVHVNLYKVRYDLAMLEFEQEAP